MDRPCSCPIGQGRMEVDAQQPLDADDGGHKDRLRDCSLREYNGVRPR